MNWSIAFEPLLPWIWLAIILIPISQIMSTTLGTGPLAGRGIDLIVYGLIIVVIAAFRPTGLLSLPWARWFRRRRPATA